ncbi:MAG: hypothetical protein H7A23_16005 [Leptospiraceae bacterium]|nr:hypothetical protein [Leptospiraceae bacterium]MCP5496051.1 hypothetical protein [Leptospiraceae bacterium]
MAFGTFKTLEEVLIRFDIESQTTDFVDEIQFEIPEIFFNFIQKNLKIKRNYISENSICESIIFPILNIISDAYDLPLWSHAKFDVSQEEGLTGIPDFLIAPISKTGVNFTSPVVCISEVKKENFDEGWTQALCEMIAAQRFNDNPQKIIYGIATSGEVWKFGKLTEKRFIIDSRAYSATANLQQVLNILNWFLGEAKKSL